MSTDTRLASKSAWYGVAALGALGMTADAADAQIVFTDVDDVTITGGEEFTVDFDGDGDAELLLRTSADGTNLFSSTLDADADGPDQMTAIVGNTSAGYQYFLPLSAGDLITSKGVATTAAFQFGPSFTFVSADPNSWLGATDKYIGVEIQIDTDGDMTTHYAWVSVELPSPNTMIVKGFAVETSPDTEIAAGAGATATDPDALEGGYLFSQVAPNPVTGRSTFELSVGQAETVTAELFDTLGRRVQTLFAGALTPGNTETVGLTSAELPAGVYVVRVTGESFVTTRNVTIVR